MHLHLTAAFGFLLAFCAPAGAIVGDAPIAEQSGVARHLVLIAGSHGNFCTGSVISRDFVMTAAHCLRSGVDYKLVELDALRQPLFRDVALVVTHPHFDLKAMLAHRVTADVALLKLAAPLPPYYVPASLMRDGKLAVPGQSFLLAGYGVSVPGDGRTGGVARMAALVATGRPGSLQLRLVDPATNGDRAGLGACTGDSGAPVFEEVSGRLFIHGVVSWATGPKKGAGCGGLTGVTPLARYRAWIIDMAKELGASL
jgi:hypothetical protein